MSQVIAKRQQEHQERMWIEIIARMEVVYAELANNQAKLERTTEELAELGQIMTDRGYGYEREGRELHRAMIVLDYISRLSELYYTKSFN